MVYEDGTATQGIDVAVSLNGGTSFTLLTNLATGDLALEPRIAVGTGTGLGSVWVLYKDFSLPYGPLVAQGAAVALLLLSGTSGRGRLCRKRPMTAVLGTSSSAPRAR